MSERHPGGMRGDDRIVGAALATLHKAVKQAYREEVILFFKKDGTTTELGIEAIEYPLPNTYLWKYWITRGHFRSRKYLRRALIFDGCVYNIYVEE